MRNIGAAARSLARRWLWVETHRCLRLPWKEAQIAAAALAEPSVEVRRLQRSELEHYSTEAVYDFSQRFLQGIASRDDLCFGAFAGTSSRATASSR